MSRCSLVSLLLAAIVVATVASTQAQASDVVIYKESVKCLLLTGETGLCLDIRKCPPVLETLQDDRPEPCGFNGTYPRVCCPVPIGIKEGPTTVQSISPPLVNFQCGVSSPKTIRYPPGKQPSFTPGSILRPGHDRPAREGVRRRRARPLKPTELPQPAAGGVTAEINAWPWMALLGEGKDPDISWFCGGVLINEQWVLSALHCFLFKVAHVVRLGEHNYIDDKDGANPKDFGVAETILYPGYIYPQAYHDLALLRLDTKVTLQSAISPVCLPWGKESSVDLTDKKVTLAGWGDTLYGGSPSAALQEVDLTVFPTSKCDKSYSNLHVYSETWPNGIGNETVCAGDLRGGRDACQGDSGGPIFSLNSSDRYTLAGIVSQGHGCGLKEYPGLYVNIRQLYYLTWIKKVAF